MRISKKQQSVTKQNLTLANMEQQSTSSFENFFENQLGPDFYDTRQWTESMLKDR